MFKTLIKAHPPITTMVSEEDVNTILTELDKVIITGIPGCVVELGCNVATTSIYIQWYLNSQARCLNTSRPFHVYDSFEGLPSRVEKDGQPSHWDKGACKCTVFEFYENLKRGMKEMTALPFLNPPTVHEGWFKDMWYPDPICFAFFDGDLYTSITDSFEKVWPNLSIGGTIIIHDVGEGMCDKVGARQACIDFLAPRGQRLDIVGGVGVVTKTSP